MILPQLMTGDEQIIFLHIPRTAGTSVHHSFVDLLGPEKVGCLGVHFDRDQLLSGHGLDQYKVLLGHFGWCQTQNIPGEKVYLTTLRDPVDRALSFHRHISSTPESLQSLSATGDLLHDLNGPFGENLRGQMSWFLDGLDFCDGKTGVVDYRQIDKLLSFIAAKMYRRHRPPVPHANVSDPSPPPCAASLARIKELTATDAEVCERVYAMMAESAYT